MKEVVVTKENLKIGSTVRRGPDWSWGSQDNLNDKPDIGVITEGDTYDNDDCMVEWSNGNLYWYRIGPEKFDLIYADVIDDLDDDLNDDLNKTFS